MRATVFFAMASDLDKFEEEFQGQIIVRVRDTDEKLIAFESEEEIDTDSIEKKYIGAEVHMLKASP